MRTIGLILVYILVLTGCSKGPETPAPDPNELLVVTPESVGYSSQKLDSVKAFAAQTGYAAVMALYDGKVFFSWGDITRNFLCHSIRKPLLGSLYGIHITSGNIDPNVTLETLGIDDIPPSLTAEEKQAMVYQLLQSRSGVYHKAAGETEEMKLLRPERGSHPPGTFFYYNNWDFNALGTIFEQETGTTLFDEFKRRIADPIGMEDFRVEECAYVHEDSLSEHPVYSFRMSARDLARFGVLYQQGGNWRGQQIIPTEWIYESTSTYSTMDTVSGIGYGYLWYTIPNGTPMAQLVGTTGYYHTGVGIHIVIILPEYKLVIVERYDTDGTWTDPGDAGLQIGLMIIGSKI